MKKTILLFVLITLSYLAMPIRSVQAHILKTDGTIGAVIHVDPDDDPYIGVPSSLFFEIKDTTGRFKPDLCDCTVTIHRGGELIDSFPLTHVDATYTFPQRGIYTITLAGKPRQPDVFDSFSLTYDIRAARESNPVQSEETTQIPIVLAATIGLTISCMIVWLISKRKRKTKL